MERGSLPDVCDEGTGISRENPMIKIAGLPVRTRLPITAWLVAGLLTLCTLASPLVQFLAYGGTANAQRAAVTHLLGSLGDQ
jgi:hypothetical protein